MKTKPFKEKLILKMCLATHKTVILSFVTLTFGFEVTLLSQDISYLSNKIGQLIYHSSYKHARWGIVIWDLNEDRPLFLHNAHSLFIPASNTKLFTAVLALTKLGPTYRIQTPILGPEPVGTDGIIKGPVAIIGQGDPTWCSYFQGGINPVQWARPAISSLRNAGVRQIRGPLIGDQSLFQGSPFGRGWELQDSIYPVTPPTYPINFGDNTVRIEIKSGSSPGQPLQLRITNGAPDSELPSLIAFTGPSESNPDLRWNILPGKKPTLIGILPAGKPPTYVALNCIDPAAWFLTTIGKEFGITNNTVYSDIDLVQNPQILSTNGIYIVTYNLSANVFFKKTLKIGTIVSPPLTNILIRILHESHNLSAQAIFLHIGAIYKKSSSTAEFAACNELNKLIAELGIPSREVQIEEGTGLSRRNLVSPMAIVQLLRASSKNPNSNMLESLLPRFGVEGTLKGRGSKLPQHAVCRAKSGYLSNCYALSGYVRTKNSRAVAFSILVNEAVGKSPRSDIDQIIEWLADL